MNFVVLFLLNAVYCLWLIDASIFHIGIGGSLETHGSLMDMPNQTVFIDNNTHIVIDTPTYIHCKPFDLGNTVSLFCPDSFLYFHWLDLFTKFLKRHSNILVKNFPARNYLNVNKINDISFECPYNGTLLTYGDNRCKIEFLNNKIKPENNKGKCNRLVPMVLPASAKITSRPIYLWTGDDKWENLFLPCIAPFYLCGFGTGPQNITFEQRKVISLNRYETHHSFREIDMHHIVTRDSKFDCLMGRDNKHLFEQIKTCVFQQPSYNTTAFNIQVDMLKNNQIPNVCFEEGICNITHENVERYDEVINFKPRINLCPKNFKTNEIIEKDKMYYRPLHNLSIKSNTYPEQITHYPGGNIAYQYDKAIQQNVHGTEQSRYIIEKIYRNLHYLSNSKYHITFLISIMIFVSSVYFFLICIFVYQNRVVFLNHEIQTENKRWNGNRYVVVM